MARQATYVPLQVLLNNRQVGILKRMTNGALEFSYEDSWLAWEHAIPISLSIPLSEGKLSGPPVISYFENLLPDNNEIRTRLASNTHAEGTDAYSLLRAIGRDCIGALQFLPIESPTYPEKIEGEKLTIKDIEEIIKNLKVNPLGIADDQDFRISIAGAQSKTALLYWKNNWYKPINSTPTTHIIKPSIGVTPEGVDLSDSVDNEYLCMKFTAALGMPTANVAIENFGSQRVLIVERFDRLWTKDNRLIRLPQEDCLQALGLPPSRKYESHEGPGIIKILETLKGSDDPLHDQFTFMKAQIIFWLLCATDGHAKNFSLRLSPGGRFNLTPLYDIVSVQPNYDRGQIQKNKIKMSMCVGEKRHYEVYGIMPRHYIQTAQTFGLPKDMIPSIFCELRDKSEKAWNRTIADLPKDFPQDLLASIQNGYMNRLNLIRNYIDSETAS